MTFPQIKFSFTLEFKIEGSPPPREDHPDKVKSKKKSSILKIWANFLFHPNNV